MSFISHTAMISHRNGFILFGGFMDRYKSSRTVARLDLATTSWSKLGELRYRRHGHGVIFDGEVFLVIGGEWDKRTEKCTMSKNSEPGSTMTCKKKQPTLDNYEYPSLFLVPDGFCA